MISQPLPNDRRAPLLYVALGDSTVYGLGASGPSRHYVGRLFDSLRVEYPSARLINRGTCLATAADVLAHQLADALVDQPDLVTLSVGPNDIRQGRAAGEFARLVEVILERLDADTRAAVVVNRLPDIADCPRFRGPERSMVAALTRRYNHALQQVTDRFGIDLVDLGIAGLPMDERRKYFCADGYHPSDDGYAAWASAMWESVRRRIPSATGKQLVALAG
jgi:lysophospholipase L1-like esterase